MNIQTKFQIHVILTVNYIPWLLTYFDINMKDWASEGIPFIFNMWSFNLFASVKALRPTIKIDIQFKQREGFKLVWNINVTKPTKLNTFAYQHLQHHASVLHQGDGYWRQRKNWKRWLDHLESKIELLACIYYIKIKYTHSPIL